MGDVLRLVDSGLVEPVSSAALDEAILESRSLGRAPDTLHFYVRSSPTVSLGYFQNAGESVDLDACRRLGVTVVRRGSGGGSIYTDRGQLIYALVAGQEMLPKAPEECFSVVCGAIAQALSSFGVEARHRPVNDIEVGGRKVSGSAQLRRRGAVLVHGTVLLDTDMSVMDAVLRSRDGLRPSERVANISSMTSTVPPVDEVKARVAASLSASLGARVERGALSDAEEATVKRFVDGRYSKDEWNLKR